MNLKPLKDKLDHKIVEGEKVFDFFCLILSAIKRRSSVKLPEWKYKQMFVSKFKQLALHSWKR
jgi:hypothetical protein